MTELGLQPASSSSIEELQQILTEYNETEKQSKKDVLTIKKFRNQLNELISNNPDAGIKNSAEDVGAIALENAVKAARITRDLFKKNKLENDKAVKAKQRADNKIADDSEEPNTILNSNKQNVVKCKHCGGNHWSIKCNYKSEINIPKSESSSNKYIPNFCFGIF